jgi:23S rRNA pseudouridine1911/1915/1917 synthase
MLTRMTTNTLTTAPVNSAQEGYRLDAYLALCLPDFSRAQLQKLIKDGHVASTRQVTQPAYKVKLGEVFTIIPPALAPLDIVAEDIPLSILFEDEYLLVIDKPSGLSVHPGAGRHSGTLVNALMHHSQNLSQVGGLERPGIVHRLDKDTTGLLVVAKTDKVHASLGKQFENRSVTKIYMALCYGVPRHKEGTIEGNIGRHPTDRQRMAVLTSGGRPAKTAYEVVETYGDCLSLLKVKLFTGRTHQIRVHLSHLGHPLVGDQTYGKPRSLKGLNPAQAEALKNFGRQALHAHVLGFTHPQTSQRHTFTSPIPADFQQLINILKQ